MLTTKIRQQKHKKRNAAVLHALRPLTRHQWTAFRKLHVVEAFREYSKIDWRICLRAQPYSLARSTSRLKSKFETKVMPDHRICFEMLWKVSSAQSYRDRERGLYAATARQPRGAPKWTGGAERSDGRRRASRRHRNTHTATRRTQRNHAHVSTQHTRLSIYTHSHIIQNW